VLAIFLKYFSLIVPIIPPVLAIALALITRRVILSLFIGVWSGYVLLAGYNPLTGTKDTALAFVDVLSDSYNLQIIVFTILVGILIGLTQKSGGVAGFVDWLLGKLGSAQATAKNRIWVQILALATGTLLFIESNISILTVGTVYRPVFDRLGISREKLAYITDTSAAPSCILIPFNAWGAYIAAQLAIQDIEQPFNLVLGSIVFNIYPILAMLILVIVIVTGRDIAGMKRAQIRVDSGQGVLREGARPMMPADDAALAPSPAIKPSARNMLIPIGVMVLSMPVLLYATGSGSLAVLLAVSAALLVMLILIASQRMLTAQEVLKTSFLAAKGMLPLAALMALAFALGTLCKALGTGDYVASLTEPFLSPALLPAIVFLTGAFISFSTGTSWGTFAIMIAIAMPLSQSLGVNPALTLAAALGGGIFGDHCSPTSDTSIITSMATANDHIDHVRTQLPYALIGGVIATGGYLVLGIVIN